MSSSMANITYAMSPG